MRDPSDAPTSGIMEMLGGTIDSFDEGVSVMSLMLEEKHMNPNGVVHGGVITTLMDEATGHAIVTIRGLEAMAETPHATVDMSVSFLSGARVGDELVCEARTLRVGRAVAFAEAEVRRRGSDDLVAKGAFTYAILAKRSG
ncbi:MAG: PaaI family thioesterase [Chloroflexi bacterium]|nr:PaaI family thioesterase [Chloroflexota bacterium]MCH8051238.1 PaaI family thioesterase [Chloroflexota bacterium]